MTAQTPPKHLSVSILESFRRFEEGLDEESKLIERLTLPYTPGEKADAGTELHDLMEHYDSWQSRPYRLIDAPAVSRAIEPIDIEGQTEVWISGDLLGHRVVARCDLIDGLRIIDRKATWIGFDAERLLDSYQWRLYLTLADCQEFVYRVFCMSDKKPYAPIGEPHTLPVSPYPAMRQDCENLLTGFLAWKDAAIRRGIPINLKH